MDRHKRQHKRRRRAAEQPFAGLQGEDSGREGLLVFGVSAEIFCDPQAAADVEEGKGLVPAWGDPSDLADRWDARLLLDPISLAAAARGRRQFVTAAEAEAALLDAEGAGVMWEALQRERYRDLDPRREAELQRHGRLLPPAGRMYFPGPGEGSEEEEEEGPSRRGADAHSYEGALPPPPGPPPLGPPDGGASGYAALPFEYADQQQSARGQGPYAAVGFSYGGGEEEGVDDAAALGGAHVEAAQGRQQAEPQQAVQPMPPPPQQEEEPFSAPFLVPAHLRGHLPATQRQYQVARQTADFVRGGGAQLEVLLRLKQAGNPAFAFLEPGDRVHPFYRWLVECDPADRAEISAAPGAAPPAPAAAAPAAGEAGEPAEGAVERQQAERKQEEEEEEEEEPAVEYGPALPPPPDALQLLGQYQDAWQQDTEQPQVAAEAATLPPQQAEQQQAEQQRDAETGAHAHGGPEPPALQQAPVPMDAASGTPPGAAGSAAEPEPGAAGKRGFGDAAGAAAADTAGGTQAGEDAEPPPPPGLPAEAWSIMRKLVQFVQRNGAQFEAVVRAREARNPRFAFLHARHPHHSHYRALLEEALGREQAAAVLEEAAQAAEEAEARRLVAVMVRSALAAAIAQSEVEAAAAAAGAASAASQLGEAERSAAPVPAAPPAPHYSAGPVPAPAAAASAQLGGTSAGPVQPADLPGGVLPPWLVEKKAAPGVKLQANPSIAKVQPRAPADAAPGQGAQPSAADGLAAAGCGAGGAGNGAQAAEESCSQPEQVGEASGREEQGAAAPGAAAAEPAAPAEPDEAELEEQRRAERRRRARELLAQRQQQQALEAARQRQQQLAEIARHRAMLLGEDGSAALAAELRPVKASQARAPSLVQQR